MVDLHLVAWAPVLGTEHTAGAVHHFLDPVEATSPVVVAVAATRLADRLTRRYSTIRSPGVTYEVTRCTCEVAAL